jgi:ABC-type microcin C transport system permease subunit YejE
MSKEVLKIALEALEPLEFLGKKMDGGNPKIDEAISAIKKALNQQSWIGLDEDEFVYFCAYVNHEILSEIENVLRDKNESKN